MPTRRTKGMGGILKAIQRGYWKKSGISYWNDLLKATFGTINKESKDPIYKQVLFYFSY